MLTRVTDTLAVDPKLIVSLWFDGGDITLTLSTGAQWIIHAQIKRHFNSIVKRVNTDLSS